MNPAKSVVSSLSVVLPASAVGCASSRTHEDTGQFLDDTVTTTKVRVAQDVDDVKSVTHKMSLK